MALTKGNWVTNTIQSLENVVKGQATAAKQAFDKAASDIKTFVNETLTEEIETQFASKEDLNGVIAGQINTTDPVTGKRYAIIIENGLLGLREVG